MNNLISIRDSIVKNLKSENGFGVIATAELDGNYFAATDIALPDSEGICEVYRIAVIKHNNQKGEEQK